MAKIDTCPLQASLYMHYSTMDLLTCMCLAAIEAKVVTVLSPAVLSTEVWPFTIWNAVSLFLLQYFALKYYRIWVYPRYFSPLRHLPGPTDNHFFFGQALHLLWAETPTSLYIRWMRENPDAPVIRYFSFANTEVLVVNSIQAHKALLQTHCYDFRKPDTLRRMVKEIVGNGIFMLEGEIHRARRKMLAAPFSNPHIRKHQPIFLRVARQLGGVFDQAIGCNTRDAVGVVDCRKAFSRATLEIIAETALGIELSHLRVTTSAYQPGAKSGPGSGYTFHHAYDTLFTRSFAGNVLLWANAFVPTRWIPVQANRDFLFATTWLRGVLTGLVRDRYCALSEAVAGDAQVKRESPDFLTYLVTESRPGGPAEGISEDELVGHLLQFMVAGHETSAMALAWSVYVLATKQDIQSKLRAEVAELLPHAVDPTAAELDSLPYLDGFVKEILRLYSPATLMYRQAEVDVHLDGVFVPKGTTVEIVPSVTMRNPHIWGEDVDVVDPSRWNRLTGDQHSPYAFEAFSNGPRICIGRSFALLEIKTIVVEMVRRYRFLYVAKPFPVGNPSLILRPTGLEVAVQKVGKQSNS